MLFVYMKCRFSLSYRDLEEMASIRGAKIDHATLQRWVIRFVGSVACIAKYDNIGYKQAKNLDQCHSIYLQNY